MVQYNELNKSIIIQLVETKRLYAKNFSKVPSEMRENLKMRTNFLRKPTNQLSGALSFLTTKFLSPNFLNLNVKLNFCNVSHFLSQLVEVVHFFLIPAVNFEFLWQQKHSENKKINVITKHLEEI